MKLQSISVSIAYTSELKLSHISPGLKLRSSQEILLLLI